MPAATINPYLTQAGLAAAVSQSNQGLSLAFTHMTLGAGQYTPALNSDGLATQSDLQDRREKITFGYGTKTAPRQITFGTMFPIYSGVAYNAGELGFWAGDPDNGGILVAVYSAPSFVHAYRNDQTELAESFSFALAKVPNDSVTVTVNPNQVAVGQSVADHEAKPNPHPQYLLRSDVAAIKQAILQTAFAVGVVYTTYDDTRSPADILGFGFWQLTAIGRFFVGQNPNDPDFATIGEQGGDKQQTLSQANLPDVELTVSGGGRHGASNVSDDGNGNLAGSPNGAEVTPFGMKVRTGGTAIPFSVLPPFEVVRKWRRMPDPAADTTPDAYSFSTAYGVPINGTATSNTVTISGLTTAVPVQIQAGSASGSAYSINGMAFTAADGTIQNGDTLTLRHTVSSTYSTVDSTTIKVGTYSAAFQSYSESNPGADTIPDSFSFANQSNAAPSTQVTSNSATISGINAPAPISVSGGSYSINNGVFTSAAGQVVNGDQIRLQVMTPTGYSNSQTATVNVGGTSASFTATTAASAPNSTPDAFNFQPVNNALRSVVVTSSVVTISGINQTVPVSVAGDLNPTYSKNGGAYTASAGTAVNGDTFQVRLMSSSSYDDVTQATLTVGGRTGTFTVITRGQPGGDTQ